jgi:hypothetical protein
LLSFLVASYCSCGSHQKCRYGLIIHPPSPVVELSCMFFEIILKVCSNVHSKHSFMNTLKSKVV